MRSLILASILLAIFHGTSASFFDDLKDLSTGAYIGIAAGAAAIVIGLIVLCCFCFECACFATSKAVKHNSPPQGQGQGQGQNPAQKRSPPPRSLEPQWDNAQPHRPQQQQYLPPQQSSSAQNSLGNQNQRPSSQYPPGFVNDNQRTSLESENGNRPPSQLNGYPPQHMHQTENFQPSPSPQRYQQSPPPDMHPQGNNYPPALNFENNHPQQSQSQPPGSHSPSPQPQIYPQSPPPQNYAQSPQPQNYVPPNNGHFNESYPMSPQEQYQQQYGKEYPIFQEQFQNNAPMTKRVVSGFQWPEGLIDELRTDGNTKLKPPPPPKPIKMISQLKEDGDNVPPPDY